MTKTIKTTLIGGLVFLLPLGLMLVVFTEILDLALVVAEPIASVFPDDDEFGVTINVVIAWILILLTCFAAGLLTRLTVVSSYSEKIEDFASRLVPGYGMIKSFTNGLFTDEIGGKTLNPVIVTVRDAERIGFEVERSADGQKVTVFLPSVPNPRTGIVSTHKAENVRDADISASDAINALMFYGKGLEAGGQRQG